MTITGDDILVADAAANKLFRVDPVTGVRSVISDFSNPAQGPLSQQALTGVAIGQGQIFVTDLFTGIFGVDPRTGNRTLVSNFNQGAVQGNLYYGLAVDAFGRVVANLQGAHYGVVRVAPRTDTRVIVSDFANQAQGTVLTCCQITDLTLGQAGAILIGTNHITGAGGQSAIYRVNPVTGYRTLLSDFTNPAQGADVVDLSFSVGLAVERSGQILANSGGSIYAPRNLLLRINPITGNRTVLSDFDNPEQGTLGSPNGLAIEKSGTIIVGAAVAASGTQLFRVNPRTGRRVLFSDSTNPRQGPSFGAITYIAVAPDNAGFYPPPPANLFDSPFGPTK
jgi:sugar lactone lactonase YvrE